MESNIEHFELNEKDSFAVYRLPDDLNTVLIHQQGNAQILLSDNYSELGFIFHPFDKENDTPYFIQAELRAINPKWSFVIKRNNKSKSTNKIDYIAMIDKTIEDINIKMTKVVMSRVIKTDLLKKNIQMLFNEMCLKYPSAFCYIVHIPSIGCWMGATPEKLVIEQSKNTFATMALAGTHQVNAVPQKWNTKELEEQLIVTKYLRAKLNKLNIEFREDKRTTLRNGPVEHLCTHFEFQTNNIYTIADTLHPTPAVCGMPKKQSKIYILKNEEHNRKYYTGYLGPTQHDGLTKLYVNLRCMELFQSEAKIYVGGGITKSSIAESEWAETTWKADTLIDLLK